MFRMIHEHARFPNVFHANRHIASVHEILKKECEQLIELTVCSASFVGAPFHLTIFRPGQSKAVD
jgi:hypothetical protein